MKRLLIGLLAALPLAAGCGSSSDTISPAQVSEQDRREYDEQQKRVMEQESQHHKTRTAKK
jgi:hypothetical protein